MCMSVNIKADQCSLNTKVGKTASLALVVVSPESCLIWFSVRKWINIAPQTQSFKRGFVKIKKKNNYSTMNNVQNAWAGAPRATIKLSLQVLKLQTISTSVASVEVQIELPHYSWALKAPHDTTRPLLTACRGPNAGTSARRPDITHTKKKKEKWRTEPSYNSITIIMIYK